MAPARDVGAADLFLLLTETPRPWVPTDAVPGGRVFALSVRQRVAINRVAPGEIDEVAQLERRCRLVAATLHGPDGPVFVGANDAAELTGRDLDQLHSAVVAALAVCSPEYGRCDVRKLHDRLKIGAASHWGIAYALGGCVDDGYRYTIERPDRFYGMPLNELTDGQWMAYRAARAFVRDKR